MSAIGAVVWPFFGIAFLWDWTENWLFPVLSPLLSFPNFLAYWVQHFYSIIFRIWNSSTWIILPPLALFVVMLPQTHLTSYSRMFGSRWVTTPSWFSWSWRSFLHSSSVYSCYLFLISSASVQSVPFLSFIVPIFAWNIPLVSNFLEELSSLSRSIVFLYFFALIPEEGFLIPPCYSLKQPCLIQWNYEPCCVGPPKTDGSWWSVLTKRGPLEKGIGNHFSILILRTHEPYEKAERYNTERWTPQVGRCPICYWRRVEK